KISGAQLRYGHSPGSQRKLGHADLPGGGMKHILSIGMHNMVDRTRHAPVHPPFFAFGLQDTDNFGTGLVTKKLTSVLFMPMHTVGFDQVKKITGGISGQRRAAKMRVLRDKLCRRGATIGKVAPPAARDPDLLAQAPRMVNQQHAQPALSGHRRGHHTSRASADHGNIITAVSHETASSRMQST